MRIRQKYRIPETTNLSMHADSGTNIDNIKIKGWQKLKIKNEEKKNSKILKKTNYQNKGW